MLKPPKIKFDLQWEESYLAFINNSVGTKAYRTFMVKKDGRKFDILKNGDLSCAFFVSSVLYLCQRVSKPSFTVAGTVKRMMKRGAKRVPLNKLKPGDVLVWLPREEKTGSHNHIGFYVGGNQAVSNNDKKKAVIKHDFEFNGKRKIEFALRANWGENHV
jgi:hypothetical protein